MLDFYEYDLSNFTGVDGNFTDFSQFPHFPQPDPELPFLNISTNFDPPEFLLTDLIKMTLLVILFSVGFPINSFVLYKQIKEYQSKKRQKHFDLGLAFLLQKIHLNLANLMAVSIYCPGHFWWHYTYRWLAGDFMCKVCTFLFNLVFQLISCLVLVIALDRLRNIYKIDSVRKGGKITQLLPTSGPAMLTPVKIMLSVAWLVSITVSSPQLFTRRTVALLPDWEQCTTIWEVKRREQQLEMLDDTESIFLLESLYNVVHIASIFWIPFVIILICYSIVVFKEVQHFRSTVQKDKRKRKKSQNLTQKHHQLPDSQTPAQSLEPKHIDSRNESPHQGRTLTDDGLVRKGLLYNHGHARNMALTMLHFELDNGFSNGLRLKSSLPVLKVDEAECDRPSPEDTFATRTNSALNVSTTSFPDYINKHLKPDKFNTRSGSADSFNTNSRSNSPNLKRSPTFRQRLISRSKLGEKKRISREAKRAQALSNKLMKSSAMVVGLYVLMWLPYNILNLVSHIAKDTRLTIDPYVDWMNSLILLNTVVSPFLYGSGDVKKVSNCKAIQNLRGYIRARNDVFL